MAPASSAVALDDTAIFPMLCQENHRSPSAPVTIEETLPPIVLGARALRSYEVTAPAVVTRYRYELLLPPIHRFPSEPLVIMFPWMGKLNLVMTPDIVMLPTAVPTPIPS